MNLRRIAWGAAFTVAGALVASGILPGTGAWSTGPRVGAGMALATIGVLLLSFSAVHWVLRKTTRPQDYEGGCPVGKTCACGHFNFKPRAACRQCGAATGF